MNVNQQLPYRHSNKEHILQQQVAQLYTALSFGLGVSLINALLLVGVLWSQITATTLLLWFGTLLVLTAVREWDRRHYLHQAPQQQQTQRYRYHLLLGSLASGLVWGLGAYILFPLQSPAHQIFVIFVMAGMAVGSTLTLSAVWGVAVAFSVPVVALIGLRLITQGAEHNHVMTLMVVLFLLSNVILARRANRFIVESITLRFEHQSTTEELRHSYEQNRSLLEGSAEGIFGIDCEGNTTFANAAAARMLGYSVSELTGSHIHQQVHHSRADGSPYSEKSCRMFAAITEGTPQFIDDEVLWRKDGSHFQVEYSSTPIIKQGAITGAVVNFRDISERRAIEEQLAQERGLFIAGPTVAFKWRASEGWPVEYVSPNIRQQFGFLPKELTSGRIPFAELVHPDDLPKIGEEVERAGAQGASHFEQEYRLADAHGKYHWVYDFTVIIRNDAGEVTHYHGYVVDISAKKQSEEALHLAATAFEAHEAIAITDLRGTFLRVNGAFSEITGYSAEEAIGQSPKLLQSGRHDSEFYREMWHCLSDSGYWEGEIWNRRKDGSIYLEWLTITAVHDSSGNASHYLAHFQDITERKQAEERIHYQAYYDALTDLPNRSQLLERLEQELARSTRHGHIGAVLFLDLDRFKTINDSLGHAVGDELLRQVAIRLKECLRVEDCAARIGGDEFVVLLNELSDVTVEAAEQAQQIAEKIRISLASPYDINKQRLHSSPSIGIALFPQGEESGAELLKQADIAMYHAKEEGRNASCFYHASMATEADERLTLENDLRKALAENQLQLHYQPQLDAEGALIGSEALVRWQHPQRGMISPGEFLSVAEASGLMNELGDEVLHMACRQIAAWRQLPHSSGLPAALQCVAVNISPSQLQLPDFVERVSRILQHYQVPASCLELEITEEMLLSHIELSIAKMRELRGLGVRFAIDDFGTGYSSLQYLARLPLDKLKIDRAFVIHIANSDSDAAIATSIIDMAHNLKLTVLAEGVEEQAQLEYLQRSGCHAFQGFYFSRPLPAEEYVAYAQGQKRVEK